MRGWRSIVGLVFHENHFFLFGFAFNWIHRRNCRAGALVIRGTREFFEIFLRFIVGNFARKGKNTRRNLFFYK